MVMQVAGIAHTEGTCGVSSEVEESRHWYHPSVIHCIVMFHKQKLLGLGASRGCAFSCFSKTHVWSSQ